MISTRPTPPPDPDAWRTDVQAVRRWLWHHPDGGWTHTDDAVRTDVARNLIRVSAHLRPSMPAPAPWWLRALRTVRRWTR